MKRICCIFIAFILILLGVKKTLAEKLFISGQCHPEMYIGQENELYVITIPPKTNKEVIYKITFPELIIKKIFTIQAPNADISMGNNEISFRNIYYQPFFVTHIGPNQYFTSPIEKNGMMNWKARTDIQNYRQEVQEQCFYSGDKLFLVQQPVGGINSEIPYRSRLYIIENDNKREALEVENGIFIFYDSGILVAYADRLNRREQYDIFDVKNENMLHVPCTRYDTDSPNIIVMDQTVYYSSNHKVFRYDILDQKVKEIIPYQQTVMPNINYSVGYLYIYSNYERMIYKYDPLLNRVISQYLVPEQIPQSGIASVHNNILIIYHSNKIYIYYLELDKLIQLDL